MSPNFDQPPYQMYQEFVSEYSERDLTKDSDAINALTGVLRRFSARVNSRLLYGLPTAVFDLSLLWQNERCFLQRRAGFPSYSWAGWKGQVSWLVMDVDWFFNSSDLDSDIPVSSNSNSDSAASPPSPINLLDSPRLRSPDNDPLEPSDSDLTPPKSTQDDSDSDESGPNLFSVEEKAMEWIDSSDSDSDSASSDSDWESDSESGSFDSETRSLGESPEGWLLSKTWIIWYERSPSGILRPVWTSEDADNLGDKYIGYGSARSEFNPHDRFEIMGDASRTEPTIYPQPTSQNLREYSLLQFWTVSVLLSLTRHQEQADWRADIFNRDGKQCGQINLHQPLDETIVGVHEFLLLSESKYFAQPTGILPGGSLPLPAKNDWGFYWVMLIRRNPFDPMVAERRGIGQIAASALRKGLGEGPAWKEIVLG